MAAAPYLLFRARRGDRSASQRARAGRRWEAAGVSARPRQREECDRSPARPRVRRPATLGPPSRSDRRGRSLVEHRLDAPEVGRHVVDKRPRSGLDLTADHS
jgi:hypothetical protein